MKFINTLKKDERGIASIVIVMVIIMILTLFTLAMANNANREQRQALDRQLSSQAFYAAESGVNDTMNYIRTYLSTVPKEKTSCDNTGFANFPVSQVGGDPSVKYTCILYDMNPTTIESGKVASDSAFVVPLQNGDGTGINTLTINWDDASGGANFAGCPATGDRPASASYTNCDAGVLRAEIIDANTLNRDSLIDSNFTAFLYPGQTAEAVQSRVGNVGATQGIVARGACSDTSTPRKCSITIGGLGINGDGKFYLRLRTLYKENSSVVICGSTNGTTPCNVKFLGAQIMVDSTGKAADVLRRIQVRVPVIPKYNESDHALKTTGSLCKLLDVYPGQPSDSDSCSY